MYSGLMCEGAETCISQYQRLPEAREKIGMEDSIIQDTHQ